MLQIMAGFLEFLLGNTFPFVVFMGFGTYSSVVLCRSQLFASRRHPVSESTMETDR